MTPRAAPAPKATPTQPSSPEYILQTRDSIGRIDPSRTAMIIQDLQNDVMIEGGAFAETGSPIHARRQNVVANAARLASVARAKGVMVIHVWMVCEPGHPFLAQHAALMQGLKGENALVRGTWGVEPVKGLEPQGADLVVEKMSMSAWETSRLESYLHHGGRDTIINCGAWTNMSVEHTARTGAEIEALAACSGAALALYDMVKAVEKGAVITDLQLERKSGGRSGDFKRGASPSETTPPEGNS